MVRVLFVGIFRYSREEENATRIYRRCGRKVEDFETVREAEENPKQSEIIAVKRRDENPALFKELEA